MDRRCTRLRSTQGLPARTVMVHLANVGVFFVVPAEAAISQCQSQVVAGRMDRAWLVLRRMAVCTSIGRNGIRAGHRQRFIIRNMSAGEAASMWSGKRLISNGRWNVAWRSSIRRSERSSSFIFRHTRTPMEIRHTWNASGGKH